MEVHGPRSAPRPVSNSCFSRPSQLYALKILHEHFPKTQLLVTGSSSFELGRSVKEPLTGRKRELLLHPVSLAELATRHNFIALRELLPRLLRFGSYPEPITNAEPAEEVIAPGDVWDFAGVKGGTR